MNKAIDRAMNIAPIGLSNLGITFGVNIRFKYPVKSITF